MAPKSFLSRGLPFIGLTLAGFMTLSLTLSDYHRFKKQHASREHASEVLRQNQEKQDKGKYHENWDDRMEAEIEELLQTTRNYDMVPIYDPTLNYDREHGR